MRIVFLVPDVGGTSGWSRYALDLGRALAARGHELHCVTSKRTGATWCHEYPILRQPTSYLGSTLLCAWHARTLTKLLRSIDPDVVHVIAEPYALLLPFTRKRRWKEILTIHGTYSVVPLLMGYKTARLAYAYYKRMNSIIAVSNFTKTYLGNRIPPLSAIASSVTVIHNAISLSGIDADTDERPDGRPFHILSVSGVKRKKGYIQSLRAIRTFLDAHPANVVYTIIGNDAVDPGFTRELHDAIDGLSLSGAVRFRGIVSDDELDAAYREADLFLLPSLQEDDYFEGFGLVFIEANARGTPVIGGNTGGCPEAISDGVSGYVCDPEKTDDIAARMEDIFLKRSIDRASCRAWAEQHDIDRTVEEIERTYAMA